MAETKKFPLISGHLSLDLVNTEVVRRGRRHDLLLSEKDVLDWLHIVKEDNPFWDGLFLKMEESIRQVVKYILEMRATLRNQFELIADGQPISDECIIFLEDKIEKAPFTYKFMESQTGSHSCWRGRGCPAILDCF